MADMRMVTGGRKLPSATDKLLDETATDCISFHGRASSQDALTSDAVWQISRVTYLGAGVYLTEFANSADFSAVWDDRTTYFTAPGACTPPFPYPKTQISDGNDTLLINPDGSINIGGSIAITSVGVETIANIPMLTANAEYNYTFPSGTKRFMMRLRSGYTFKYSPVFAQSGTNYLSAMVHSEEGIEGLVTRTIFFQSKYAGEIMEISSWV